MNTISDTAVQKKRFTTVTAVVTAADTILFVLIAKSIAAGNHIVRLLVSLAASNALSSVIHYMLCCRYVFRRKDVHTARRYAVLFVVKLGLCCCLLGILCGVCNLSAFLVKIVYDTVWVLTGYHITLVTVFNPSDSPKRTYGRFARTAQTILRLFSPRYDCDIPHYDEPVVYVCRHLNMHGPYTTLKWIPIDLHPLVLGAFFDKKAGYEHMRKYTFSSRWGKKAHRFSILSFVSSRAAYAAATSLQAIPVYRNSSKAITTMKTGLRFLKQGESLIVFPDINYTGSYNDESDIYSGFLRYGEMYEKSTGKPLRFVPLMIDDEKRVISASKPIEVGRHDDLTLASEQIRSAINKHTPSDALAAAY